jgi:hypothetical protein
MPLSAIVWGEKRLSTSFSCTEWLALRASRTTIALPCCGSRAYLRTSSAGLQHFYHASNTHSCVGSSETALHLELKGRILKAVISSGWRAETEFAELDRGWRADVMAWRGSARIAFEVQLAPIDIDDLHGRHDTYKESDVRGCWFLGARSLKNSQLPAVQWKTDRRQEFFQNCSEPFFSIRDDGNVSVGGVTSEIETVVAGLLNRRFKYVHCRKIDRSSSVRIYRVSSCYGCKRDFDVYFVFENDSPRCGDPLSIFKGLTDEAMLHRAASAQVIDQVKRILARESQRSFFLSFPAWQESSSGRRYIGFRCFHCRALMGAEIWPSLLEYGHFNHNNTLRMIPIAEFELFKTVVLEEDAHWCYSLDRAFCDDRRVLAHPSAKSSAAW